MNAFTAGVVGGMIKTAMPKNVRHQLWRIIHKHKRRPFSKARRYAQARLDLSHPQFDPSSKVKLIAPTMTGEKSRDTLKLITRVTREPHVYLRQQGPRNIPR